MIDKIGDLKMALTLAREMKIQADEVVEALSIAETKSKVVFTPELFEDFSGTSATGRLMFAQFGGTAAPANANVLAQVDQIWRAVHAISPARLRKSLDKVYADLYSTGVSSEENKQRFTEMAERVNSIRTAQDSIKQLTALGVPSDLVNQVSASLGTVSAERFETSLKARRALGEPGHLGDRVSAYIEQMEKAGSASLTDEERREDVALLECVDAYYDFLSKVESICVTGDRLRATVHIDGLDALQLEVQRTRDSYLKLMVAGEITDIEARVNDFLAVAKVPTKS